MEQITEILKSIQIDMQIQNQKLETMERSLTDTINKKFTEIESKHNELISKVDEQEKRIDNIERYIRRKNVVIFGLEEQEKSYGDLEKEILRITNEIMSVQLTTSDIDCLYRVGKKGSRTRPILLSLTTVNKKIQIIKRKNKLSDTPYYMKDDYPTKILNERKTLNEQVKKLKSEGKNAIIKYNKIIILKDRTPLPTNKRNLSQSPDGNVSNYNAGSVKPTSKKNKYSSMTDYLQQKPRQTDSARKYQENA